ncbi:pheromone-regulated protein prm10 [Rhodotorula sphaerocarpa]
MPYARDAGAGRDAAGDAQLPGSAPAASPTPPPPRLIIPGSDLGEVTAAARDFADQSYEEELRGRAAHESRSTTRSGSGDHSSDDTLGGHTASSVTMLNSSQGSHAVNAASGAGGNGGGSGSGSNGRRVQWTPNLPDRSASHLTINVKAGPASPTSHDLSSPGASAELQRALEAAAASSVDETTSDDDGDIDRPHGRGPFQLPGMGDNHSRAASSDGEPEERLEALKDNMEIYVDPGERDGLPSASHRDPAERNTKAAWNLVRGMTMKKQLGGPSSSLRRRKQSEPAPGGFTSGTGAGGDPEKPNDEDEGGLGRLANRFREGNVGDIPQNTSYQSSGAVGGGGILSALIALQQQQNGGDSGATSGANTPSTMGPSSRAASINGDFSDEEDEEEERRKFLAKLHEKRARRNQLHQFADSVGSGVTGVGSAAGRGATAVIGTAGRGAGAVIGTAGRGAGAVIGGAGKAVGAAGQAFGVQQKTSKNTSAATTPAAVDSGESKSRHRHSTFFNKTRSVVDKADRPDAAKSSAGVFGGLVLGAASLGGVSTPSAATLTPDPTRSGTHLQRWDMPPPTEPHSRTDSADSSRPGSPLTGRSAPPSPGAGSPTSPTSPTSPRSKGSPFSYFKEAGHAASQKMRYTPSADSPKKEYGDYFSKETEEEMDRKAWEKEKRRRRKEKAKRKAHEVFITQHVAAILERQQFIMKQARAFMMFGAPSHRLEAQMQATARVLEINCQVIYIPGVMLISFGDAATHTSDIKFLKQSNGLDLGKLLTAYLIYYRVIHDQISVTEASSQLDALMVSPPLYALWQQLVIGAAASAFIQPSAFYGSFIDCLMAMPLGALLVLVQVLVSRNDLYSSLFEIVIACVIAFISAALASTHKFCFSAIVSGAVVLILPGYIVLSGSLELANRSLISGSVRLVYAILYSLFLGFGLSIGTEVYARTGLKIWGLADYTCSALRGPGVPWYRNSIPPWWYFLTIPMFLLVLALRNGQPLFRKETIVMLVVGSAGFVSNFYSGKAFVGRPDISSAIGSFAVGLLGNLYGKFTRGSPFVVMVPGVLIQLPSGLSNGGLLRFAQATSNNNSAVGDSLYSGGFSTASSLIEVAIGLTVGLFTSAALVNVFGGGRRRGSNLSSF